MDGKFSCLQTPEISQNRKIISGRRGHEYASRWKPTMTEGASPKVVPHGSRSTRRRNGGKFSCLQTLEISQNWKIVSGRGDHGDSLRRKPATTSPRAGLR